MQDGAFHLTAICVDSCIIFSCISISQFVIVVFRAGKRASMSWFTEGGKGLHGKYFRHTELFWTICSGELPLTSYRRIDEN